MWLRGDALFQRMLLDADEEYAQKILSEIRESLGNNFEALFRDDGKLIISQVITTIGLVKEIESKQDVWWGRKIVILSKEKENK